MADNKRLRTVMAHLDTPGTVLIQPCWKRCFAGHAVGIFGTKAEIEDYILRCDIDGPLFMSPKTIAQRVLKLNDKQAESLFTCTNTLAQLRAKVKAIVTRHGQNPKGEES